MKNCTLASLALIVLLAPGFLLAQQVVGQGQAAKSPASAASLRKEAARDSALAKKMAAVLPSEEEERWLEIPWRTNIAEARTEAARVGKPVLLWVMNGNPIGCG